jgi:large-conductance mechanosensitive channel
MGGTFFSDLRRFLKTDSVIELGAAFAIATAGVELVRTVVISLVQSPIDYSTSYFGSQSSAHGTFTIHGRVFDYEDPLIALLITVVVILAAGLVVRWSRSSVFADDLYGECPHCLAEIPIGASVCSFCTRELPEGPAEVPAPA